MVGLNENKINMKSQLSKFTPKHNTIKIHEQCNPMITLKKCNVPGYIHFSVGEELLVMFMLLQLS